MTHIFGQVFLYAMLVLLLVGILCTSASIIALKRDVFRRRWESTIAVLIPFSIIFTVFVIYGTIVRSVPTVLFACLVLVSGLAIIAGILLSYEKHEKYWRKRAQDVMSRAQPLESRLFTGKEGYRLGDMVKYKRWRNKSGGKAFHLLHFPHSIATEYMSKTDENNKLDILEEIVKKRSIQDKVPNHDELVVHLRVGDVVEYSYSLLDSLTFGSSYVSSLPFLANGLKQLKNVKSVTIIAGIHYSVISEKKSLEYIAAVRQFFLDVGLPVSLRIGGDPDDDFVFMCNANFFIPSGGGYANLVNIIRHNLS